ncbi:MAG: hypothetical protein ACFFDK_14315 [Promethearchaeota archaeon]
MALADLTQLEILEGSLGLIWVLIAIFIGLKAIFRAIAINRRRDLITVGLSYIFVSSAWFGVAFQFISYGFFDVKLDAFTYLMVANIFIPFALICWVWSYCEILKPKSRNILLIVFFGFAIVWELFIIIGLLIDISLVGTLHSTFDSSHSPILLIFTLTGVFLFLITGTIFAVKSMRLEDPEVQWKGRFLLLAWISFGIGAILDAALTLNAITIIIIRIILISSAIEFYFGFFLPKKISEKLIS